MVVHPDTIFSLQFAPVPPPLLSDRRVERVLQHKALLGHVGVKEVLELHVVVGRDGDGHEGLPLEGLRELPVHSLLMEVTQVDADQFFLALDKHRKFQLGHLFLGVDPEIDQGGVFGEVVTVHIGW